MDNKDVIVNTIKIHTAKANHPLLERSFSSFYFVDIYTWMQVISLSFNPV